MSNKSLFIYTEVTDKTKLVQEDCCTTLLLFARSLDKNFPCNN